MPTHLVRFASFSHDPTPARNVVEEEVVVEPAEEEEPRDAVERRWMRRLAAVIETPGETVEDAAQVTPYRGRADSHLGRISTDSSHSWTSRKSLGLPSTRVEELSS